MIKIVATKNTVMINSNISGDLNLKNNKLILGDSKISHQKSDDSKTNFI